MAVALVADAHLGGPGGRGEQLIEEMRTLDGSGCRLLLLLGDLFHIWVGDRRYETDEIRRLMPELDALRSRGVAVRYVEGNRDFYLRDSDYARHFDSVSEELAFEDEGVRYLAVHGDGLDPSDWRYRFWKLASKNAVSRFFSRRLPATLARRFVGDMERRLQDTNFAHRIRVPEEALRCYGAGRLEEGHDVLLLGHYHQAHRWRVPGGEVRILDAWFNERRLEWLNL